MLQSVGLDQVRVGGIIGRRIELTWRKNLILLDWERDFVAPFRQKQRHGDYIGLGKSLDGLILLARYTYNPQLIDLKNRILGDLLASQLDDGYIGAHVPEARVVKLWDVHEMAYLIWALTSHWRLFAAADSLDAAVRAADYIITHLTGAMAERGWTHSVLLDTCGLDRALLALYAQTHEERFLRFVIDRQKLPQWNLPIVEGRHGDIEGHAYAYMTRCLAQLDLYELTGDAGLLDQTNRLFDYLLNRGGLVVTGTCGQHECWHSDPCGEGKLGETCATAYLIRLCGKMLRITGDLRYGDIMERAVHNALFSAQSPDGRRIRYYVPFQGPRVYWDRDTYCCPGNFRRIIGELPLMLYYRNRQDLVVNLYSDSELDDGSVRLSQRTDYPESGNVRLTVVLKTPSRFAITLRRPAWCGQFDARVNGATWNDLRIEREWRSGDVVDIAMAMPARLVRGRGCQTGKVARLRGPLVLSHVTDGDVVQTYFTPTATEVPVDDELMR